MKKRNRKSLIRLAHSMPAGSEDRRNILAGLVDQKIAADKTVVDLKLTFDHSLEEVMKMWNDYAQREGDDEVSSPKQLDPENIIFLALSSEIPLSVRYRLDGKIK